jgi:8-amino-7-oxononanoate synthase
MTGPDEELRKLAADGLLRRLNPLDSPAGAQVLRDGRKLWNFASNDYLGLASDPRLAQAFIEGIQRYGAGAAASRLVCGTLPPHHALEEQLAAAKQTQAALLFPSGFATALGIIPAVTGKGDFILLDKLCHACLIDAARLSGATLRVFPHNDLRKLAALLTSIRSNHARARILVATESVFSMDGDLCPLRGIVELVERHDAWLLLDEAHGFGVLGDHGMGLAEQENLQPRITFQMGTLSKAAGLAGGYVAASRPWIDLLINRARSFIYTTAPPAALAHAAITALEIIRSSEGASLRARLRDHIRMLRDGSPTAILPFILGHNSAALAAADSLISAGFLVPAIRFPTVPRGTARLRVSLSAAHPREAVTSLKRAMNSISPA